MPWPAAAASSGILLSSFEIVYEQIFTRAIAAYISVPVGRVSDYSPYSTSARGLPSVSIVTPHPKTPFAGARTPKDKRPIASEARPIVFYFYYSAYAAPTNTTL